MSAGEGIWFGIIGMVVLVVAFAFGRTKGMLHERGRICFGYEAAQQQPPKWIECGSP